MVYLLEIENFSFRFDFLIIFHLSSKKVILQIITEKVSLRMPINQLQTSSLISNKTLEISITYLHRLSGATHLNNKVK